MADNGQIELPIEQTLEQPGEPPKKKRRLWVWLLGGFAGTLVVKLYLAVISHLMFALPFQLSFKGPGCAIDPGRGRISLKPA